MERRDARRRVRASGPEDGAVGREVRCALVVAAWATLTLTACTGGSPSPDAGPPAAAVEPQLSAPRPRSFRVVAAGFSFEPNRIDVEAGRLMTVTLVNAGATEHNITFELPEEDGGWQTAPLPVVPGERGVLSFRAPSKPGRYQYSCRVADHTERGMVGTLDVVEAAPAAGEP